MELQVTTQSETSCLIDLLGEGEYGQRAQVPTGRIEATIAWDRAVPKAERFKTRGEQCFYREGNVEEND